MTRNRKVRRVTHGWEVAWSPSRLLNDLKGVGTERAERANAGQSSSIRRIPLYCQSEDFCQLSQREETAQSFFLEGLERRPHFPPSSLFLLVPAASVSRDLRRR
jgi:hypothetical protein